MNIKGRRLLYTILASCLGLINQVVVAQNRTVVEVEVEKDDKSIKNKLGNKNLIKINPLLFLRGDIPIYYERAIADKFSVELGLGMTLRDYISNFTTLNGQVYQDNVSIDPKLGFSINIGGRYYPSNYIYQPEGVFFGLDYRFQHYNAVVNSANDIKYDLNITEQNNDARLMFGYLNYFEENVFIEWYTGFGIRYKSYDAIDIEDNNKGFNSVSFSEKSFMLPFLSAGFKLGLAF